MKTSRRLVVPKSDPTQQFGQFAYSAARYDVSPADSLTTPSNEPTYSPVTRLLLESEQRLRPLIRMCTKRILVIAGSDSSGGA